jgi:eukaryotic-like serine/threonine-protein kinase
MDQTVKLMKAKLGPDHPRTCTAIANLALCYREDGKPDLAVPLFEEAAAGVERLRFQHEQARSILQQFIESCESIGQLSKAELWQRKWMAVVKERSGPDSMSYASELANLGSNLLAQKKWSEAESVLRDCLTIREKTRPDFWLTFNTMSMLGDALLGQNKVTDAQPLLFKSYEELKRRADTIPASARTARLTEAVQRLVALYEMTDNEEEAERWQRELTELKKQ